MAKLTVKQLEALTSADDGKTLREDGGLVGKVRAGLRGTTVLFRYEFKLNGAKRDHRLGSWPKKSLAEIRAGLIDVKSTVAKGIDPTQAKKAGRIEAQAAVAATIAAAEQAAKENLTVADLVDDWLKDGVARQDGNKELVRSFSKDVMPQIGSKPLRELSEKDLLVVLRAVKARGLNRAVVVLHNNLKQMLRWGEKRKPWRALMVDGNPAELIDVEKLLDPDYQEERDRILSPQEIRELHDIFTKLEHDYASLPAGRKYEGIRPVSPQVQLAVWICFGTLCRIGELLKAEWQQVDLENGIWRIPAENTKGKRGKRQEHIIFLSGFARRQFYALHALTGSSPFLFPASRKDDHHLNEKTVSKQIGDRQIQFKDRKPLPGRQNNNTLVLSNGANGEWTPHDMRRTGATMMQELGVALDIIDRCQNHVLAGSKVRRHYLHHDYAKEKAAAWQALGQRIEVILEGRGAAVSGLLEAGYRVPSPSTSAE